MPKFFADSAKTLTTNLVAAYKLNEGDGSRYEELNPGTGPAAQFTASNGEYLSHIDDASLRTGDIDFTLSAWVYLDSKVNGRIVAKLDGTTNFEYSILYNQPGVDRFVFTVSSDGSTTANVQANTFGAPSTGTWYFVVAWHDATANTINIQINNGSVDSLAHSRKSQDSNLDGSIELINARETFESIEISFGDVKSGEKFVRFFFSKRNDDKLKRGQRI